MEDSAAEALLIRLLSHSESRARITAVRALEDVGSLQSVESLVPLTKGLVAGNLKQAAQQAIEKIQARAGVGGERGQLSLAGAGDQRGALSPAEGPTDGGELSLDGEDPAQSES
jgi:hypothetical protein